MNAGGSLQRSFELIPLLDENRVSLYRACVSVIANVSVPSVDLNTVKLEVTRECNALNRIPSVFYPR